eukprot:15458482-Alexandrium_andersonii.AAC.1
MGEEAKRRARSLAYILTMTTEGRALHEVSSSLEPDNGYDMWRRFLEKWEPEVKGRFRAMLQGILEFSFEGDEGAAKD